VILTQEKDKRLAHNDEEFLSKVQNVFFLQLVERIWIQLKSDP